MRSPATASESNAERLWGQPNATPYVKDALHRYLIPGDGDAVNPAQTGTKAAAHYSLDVPAGGCVVVRLRLAANPGGRPFGKAFDEVFRQRLAEADEFYEGSRRRRSMRTSAASTARPSLGCSGASNTTTSTSTAGSRSATRTP